MGCLRTSPSNACSVVPVVPSSDELTGDDGDVRRVAKQCMNLCSAKRMISKQEACVLLAEMDLTLCSETIENVSISKTRVIRNSEEETTDKKFIDRYAQRPLEFEAMSLFHYFLKAKNTDYVRPKTKPKKKRKYIIPNFVGVNGTPKFPVTDAYARHSLIVYKPWRTYPNSDDWKNEFETFVNGTDCPASCRMTYDRVMRRHYDGTQFCEPVAKDGNHGNNAVSLEDAELMDLVGLKYSPDNDFEIALLKRLDRGLEFQWDKRPQVRKLYRNNYTWRMPWSWLLTALLLLSSLPANHTIYITSCETCTQMQRRSSQNSGWRNT